MIFRDVIDARGNVARWISSLGRKSGVYVIRRKALIFSTVLYVGESHTGSLRKTLLRHFQKWKGKTAGQTYDRSKVEIAVVVCAKDKAVDRQNDLIRELDPSDNTVGKESWPF